MTRLAEIEAQIGSINELRDIVGAMRSLAGMRAREAQGALPGIRRYAEAVARAIGTAFLLAPQPAPAARRAGGRGILVLCAAEHGFVGGFNDRLLVAAGSALASGDALFVLGSRGAALVREHGRAAAWTSAMATRLAAVPDTVHRLSAELYARVARGEVAGVAVMFARTRQGGFPTVERRQLLPLDPASLAPVRLRQPPLHNLEPRVLLEQLIAEYVFARLTEAAVESLASENAARLAAMAAAHDNVSEKLGQLRQQARETRQSEVTTELIDLVTGAEALAQGDAPGVTAQREAPRR